MWAISLLTNISLAVKSLPQPGISTALQETIANVLHVYLLASPLAQVWDSAGQFALHDNVALEDLCKVDGYLPNEARRHLAELIAFRKHLSDPAQVESYLDRFLELPRHVQELLVLALRDNLYSTTKYDATLAKWLEQTEGVAKILKEVPETVVDPLLEVLAEFQQHQIASWSIRLPHLLTYVIEVLEDPVRKRLLATHVLRMSASGGLGSAVQRLAGSRTWSEWPRAVESWRGNLLEMARHSEPWVAGRVRSISATVSRLIGPHRRNSEQKYTRGVEDDARENDGG